ncbi:MAG: T9SS type A sorting domain-containing protein [Lewinellaceae bacterium]|nr:T9SS type A sorting domain-containing protein [Lewinellaceae bacterium]
MKNIYSALTLLILATLLNGQPTIIFEDDFNTASFGTEWSLNIGTNGLIEINNGVGINGSFGVMIGKSVDENIFTTNALDLHLDLSGQTDVKLSFFIADNVDETQIDDGLLLSDNGGITFYPVLNFFPDEWSNPATDFQPFYGQFPPIDIFKLATDAGLTMTSNFVIRFQQTGLRDFYGFGGQDGFFIDNVVVYNENIVYGTLPFQDNFNNNSYKPSWSWTFADETVSINTPNSPTSNMNYVGVGSINLPNSTPVLFMGRRSDGYQTTNAFDLHLDLSSETDVEMTFWIADNVDETQDDDGLYFSNDGGITFHPVLNFFPSEWCNPATDFQPFFGHHPPIDVDEFASQVGLELTSRFVIRFQQVGDKDFYGFNGQDGFFIDDVNVYDPNLVYANLPFEETFETGDFQPYWAWNFADQTVQINTDNEITSPMSFVDVVDNFGHNNSTYSAWIGKRCDGVFITNALDLHLNLLNQSNVELTFWLADNFDETQIDDGIYLSVDAGANFEPIFDFDFSNTPDLIYEFYQLDIASLANIAGLSLSEQTVIRFQQTGRSDFNGFNGADGIFLDNINVTGMTTSVKELDGYRKVQIFPNPTSKHLKIVSNNKEFTLNQVWITDINGKVVLNIMTNSCSNCLIDVNHIPVGLYVISMVLENEEIIHRKIIKK